MAPSDVKSLVLQGLSLWIGLVVVGWLTYTRTLVLHIRLAEVGLEALIRFQEGVQRVWVGADGLLEQAVEEQPAALGHSAVEAEGVLVQVVGQLLLLDAIM